MLDGSDSVFGRESSHHQRQLAVGWHLDRARINPLHVGRGTNIATAHSYDKLDVGHGFSHRIELETGRRKPPPISFTECLCLRGLAVHFRFQVVCAADIHLDLLGLGFGLLRKTNLQRAPVVVGAHLTWIDGTDEFS